MGKAVAFETTSLGDERWNVLLLDLRPAIPADHRARRPKMRGRAVATPALRGVVRSIVFHLGPGLAYHITLGSTSRSTPRSLSRPAGAFWAPSGRDAGAEKPPSAPALPGSSARCTTHNPARSAGARRPRR